MQASNNIIFSVTISSLNHEGRGITHIEGKTIFVDQALPDEIVDIEITKKHSRYHEAEVIKIIQASPDRITPKCQHFDICGGCQLQHLSSEAQLQLKKNNLIEQFKHLGKINTESLTFLDPITSAPWGYRYKGRLSVKYVEKKQKLLIGFHEKNGRYIADISRCEILHSKVGLNIELIRQCIFSLSIYKHIAQIEIASDAEHTALIIRHLTELPENDRLLLKKFGEENHFYIYLQPNKPDNLEKLVPDNQDDFDLGYSINDIQFKFYPTDFTQINPAVNDKMINLAIKLLDLKTEDIVLDLFCGLGNFSLPMAKIAHSVTGIEGDKNMVGRAKYNASLNQLSNTAFFTSNLFELDPQEPWLNKKYTKILLDPPRTGAVEILPFLHTLNPERIVYVSCNPATLARDVGELVNKYGYQLKMLCLMDMFPQTKHIESIILLTR
jgi:23S rRNA (uracil1939-C5)-methyltransferase